MTVRSPGESKRNTKQVLLTVNKTSLSRRDHVDLVQRAPSALTSQLVRSFFAGAVPARARAPGRTAGPKPPAEPHGCTAPGEVFATAAEVLRSRG